MRPVVLFLMSCLALPASAQLDDIVERNRHAQAQQHYEAGEEAMKSEDYDAAVREFRQAIDLYPQLVLAHYGLGQAYMALRRYPDAVRTYLGCREIFERRASLTQRERNQLDRDRTDQIQQVKEMIRELRRRATRTGSTEPSYVMQLEERVRVLESAGLKGAEQSLQVPAWLSLALGSAYLRQGLLPDAERAYRAALSVEPKMGAAHNNLAFIYMQTRRYDEAQAAVRHAEKSGFQVNPLFKDELKRRAATDTKTP